MVIERPRLTSGPANVTGVKEHDSVHYECHFNSSLLQYLAICVWLKNGDPTSNGKKWQTTEPGFENHLICNFDITSASVADEGSYSCYCYYNESFRKQLHLPENKEIRSQFGKGVLQFERSMQYLYVTMVCYYVILFFFITENHKSLSEGGKRAIEISVASSLGVAIFALVIWRVVVFYKKIHVHRPGDLYSHNDIAQFTHVG